MNEEILKLTNSVYKVLDFFPESDPLKNRAKDRALAIMENLVLLKNVQPEQTNFIKERILNDIDVLLGYLWVGMSQGWLNAVNCFIVSNEYEKIAKELTPSKEQPKPVAKVLIKKSPVLKEIPERQKIIVDFLAKKGKAQVMDLQTVLPKITKRTIRRDLDELLGSGRIKRLGQFNQVFYEIKR